MAKTADEITERLNVLLHATKNMDEVVQKYVEIRDLGKRCYEDADIMLNHVLANAQPGSIFLLPEGREVVLVDNFLNTNKVFKPCAVSRYDLVEPKVKKK